MTTLMIHVSALFLGFLIVVIVALTYAFLGIKNPEPNTDDKHPITH